MKYEEHLPPWLANLNPEIFLSDNFLTLDLETTTYGGSPTATNPDNDIVSAAWIHGLDEAGRETFLYGGCFDMFPLIQACYEADYIVAHNGKFDITWLIRAGIDPRKILLADTMIAEYVLTGNLKAGGKNGGLSLNALTTQYMGEGKAAYVDKCMKGGVNPIDLPISFLERRNRADIQQTRDLWLILRERMAEEELLPLFYTRCLLSPVLADIELTGVYLEAEPVIAEHEQASKDMARVDAELAMILEGRNPRSSQQMCEFLYDVLKFPVKKNKGVEVRKADKMTVAALKPKTKKQEKFIAVKQEFAQLNADLTKNLDYFYGVVKEKNSFFYAQFNQCQTVTHRLSSSGLKTSFEMFDKPKSIQLQNSPRKYKKLYGARHEGWKVIELDGAQIEFRVAGYIGQDVRICQDIIDGVDVHTFTAHVLNGCTEEEVTKHQRTAAKAHTFKPLYGGQFGSDSEMAYYQAFRDKYPGIARTQKKWEAVCLRKKQFTIATGLTFHFPGCSMSKSGYNKDFPSICNYPVQNLATAEVIPIAITAAWYVMGSKGMEAFMSNTVHDSVVVESPDHECEEVYNIGKWAFLKWVYKYLDEVYNIQFNVPLGVGFQCGPVWGRADELTFSPTKEAGEYLQVKDNEVTVMAVPPTRMAGVDYSKLEQ